MKKEIYLSWILVMSLFVITSCTQQQEMNEIISDSADLKSGHLDEWEYMSINNWYYTTQDLEIETCEEADFFPFLGAAMVSIFNDIDFLYIKVTAEESWQIHYLSLNMFSEGETPNANYGSFPYQKHFSSDPRPEIVIYKIPKIIEWSECIKINIKIKMYNPTSSRYWWVTSDNTYSYNYYLDYCLKECNPCPPEKVGDIIAAQHYDVGDLVIWEADDKLYINYQLGGEYTLDEAHVYVGCIEEMPATKKGSPKNGNFPYHIEDFDNGILMIPLADLENICKDENGCWPIAAHAVVSKTMGNEKWEETAWSTGTEFDGKNWGWYSTYCPCE
ncbi:hypothetical protein [Saccharicrinis sp. GN24d3]|uniref:hypothetical protein n=1 Tax=Saccharicrinis sp. GN24d3 TaxID=3458416 RepID=UPI004035818A